MSDDVGDVPIVCVGASAGGLEAFSELLAHLPATLPFAVVFIQHLQPTHESDLAIILKRRTPMPVVQAEHGMLIEPAHVYVIPPNVEMRMDEKAFLLYPRPSGIVPSLTIDVFLTSLAEQRGNRAIGVILSGSAHDGTKGLAAIKSEGGIALVQDPDTAAHGSMPESAIAANVADLILPIEEIAHELVRLSSHPYLRQQTDSEREQTTRFAAEDEAALASILSHVHSQTGLDLNHYKKPTLLRRIGRRMVMKHVESLSEYALCLDSDPTEVRNLLSEVLVRVTSFFRDPAVFEALKTEVFPSIVNRRSPHGIVRIWVPGCATGQEVYSLAIVLLEYLESLNSLVKVQIFASDLRENDLAFARRGVYSSELEFNVSAERLARFFTKDGENYRICQTLREMCVFARHDVTHDPPFARLDFVSCRNLLIYLDTTFQRRILGVFHYALVADGFLLLGKSEGTGSAPNLFRRTNTRGVMQRMPGNARELAFGNFSRGVTQPAMSLPVIGLGEEQGQDDTSRQLDTLLLDRYAPAAVFVDDALHIKQIRGNASEYLHLSPGDATLDLMQMLPIGLSATVSTATAEARETGQSAHRNAVHQRNKGGHSGIGITVIPVVADGAPPNYAILFSESLTPNEEEGSAESAEVEYLRQELKAANGRLRILQDGRDAIHESLRAANEEIQSSNEELQSMNEELETAKEELQSTNEELMTLNDELGVRNVELGQRNDDLSNFLKSASVAMLVLGADLTIRRFTAEAADLFNLIPSDVGRRVTQIRWNLALENLEELLTGVIQSGQANAMEVEDDSGHWFKMTITPYLTGNGTLEGAVVTLLDIDSLHRSQLQLMRTALLSEGANRVSASLNAAAELNSSLAGAAAVIREILDASEIQLVSLQNNDWVLAAASPASDPSVENHPLSAHEVDQLGLNLDAGCTLAEKTAEDGALHIVPLLSSQNILLGALRMVFDTPHKRFTETERNFIMRTAAIIAIFIERARHAEVLDGLVAQRTTALEETTKRLAMALGVKNAFLANMSHELRTPLNSVIGFSQILLDGLAGDLNGEQRRQIEMVFSAGKHLLDIVSDLLDIERITAGAMPVTVTKFKLSDVVQAIGEMLKPLAESKGLEIRLPAAESPIVLQSDELKTRQILLNLLDNAIKFTQRGHIAVSVETRGKMCAIVVEDTGCGMTPKQLQEAFEEFRQVGDVTGSFTDGTGLGLSIAERLAQLLGGSLSAVSEPGVGSTFTVMLALRIKPVDLSLRTRSTRDDAN